MNNAYIDLGGTHRAQTAIETLATLKPLLKKLQITRVANVTGLDCIGIPVFIAIRPNAKHISVSQGKGMTLELAKASAIMESIEQWHAENIPPPAIQGAYGALKQFYPLVDPCLIAHSIYATDALQQWPLNWCEAIDVMTEEKILVPYEAVSLDSTNPTKAALLFQTSTNGLASGNTLEEAMIHAFCEVIERDAYFKWCLLSSTQKREYLVDNTTINSKLGQQLLALLSNAGINVKIWDITSDLGVPVFQCVLADETIARSTQVFAGKGCHLDKEIALARAITEAVQVRLTFITGSRDDVFPSYYKKPLLANNTIISGKHDYHTIPQPEYQHDFKKNIQQILQLFSRKDFKQILVLNHTREDVGIPVVHVVVPNLKMKIEA